MSTYLIKLYHDKIPTELCREIIDKFEHTDNKYPGVIGHRVVNKDVKDTLDFKITMNSAELNQEWIAIDNTLHNILSPLIQEYISTTYIKNVDRRYLHIDTCHDTGYQIQKYTQNSGKYIYHNDMHISNTSHRILTYIFYLNTVDEGGETEFFGDYAIKPKIGNILIFPACWTFPHTGKMPISHDKYIITGWIYVPNNIT